MRHRVIPKEELTAEETYQVEAHPKAEYRQCSDCGTRYYTTNGDKACPTPS